ncbi:lipa and NB-ARC domain protein [Aspergillus steynii IBT 23096]|uniref:Lipa and NB-ARC domain protein n=1 Tax=Aspergillus steynii IBT 23096 TaxID=1392250 RepID=A0A2I2GJ01_9EURO|nr:lipa and NB-ARC domain protein [Aspergillus steynii IBT 23096]PLB52856.1 lipa and NB-ARC domain protein [Aspergillus steynii IBT 23096]
MTSLAARVKQYGLTQVYCCPEKPLVDIVLVHGLNGHPYKTWATESGVFWPADLLPEVLGTSRVRILTYGYNANVTAFTDGTSKDRILNHAETLASGLAANRNLRACSDRPIIFVCHSLGGLVVKRALIYSRNLSNEKTEHLRSIFVSTYGILFLGTPHNGSDIAKWGLLLQNICSAVLPRKFFDTSPHLVRTLRSNNETLQNINSLFVEIMGRFHIYFFHETLSTDVKGSREVIVDESSAAPVAAGVERMGIESDHRHMCKFEDDGAPGYEAVAEALLRYSHDAPRVIHDRWAEEEETRRVMKRTKARELFSNERMDSPPLGGSEPDLRAIGRTNFLPASSPSVTLRDYEIEEPSETSYSSKFAVSPDKGLPPPEGRHSPVSELAGSTDLSLSRIIKKEPLFVVPPGFHPNATFVGMQKELDILHTRLFKAKKRSQRLVAVLISGGPGSGKSHLAREYVWSYRDSYSGGVFWIDAKSRESVFKCFWDIAQAATLTDGEEYKPPDTKVSQKYVESVRTWFQGREEWLLIFDGLSFDHENDLNHFKQFLPFNKQCSIIYTSVDRTLRKKQRLYEPYSLQMSPFQVEDACKLLFKDLGIKKPSHEQVRKAIEIVTHYECLPLAIHAISHRLSATEKPMERYHLDSHLTDEKLAEPFLGIMHDLYRTNHFEALNLINLLSFFGHQVPIGMINLGKQALENWNVDIYGHSRVGDSGDIDTTIGFLIRYGLIERTSDAYALQAKALSPRSERGEIFDVKAIVPELSESQTESSQDAFFSIYQNSGSIDMIKIHSVVQGFCRDELKIRDKERRAQMDPTAGAGKQVAGYYNSWLMVATRVFILSYENAKKRMDQTDNYGLVKDYREYETHASVLANNFPRKFVSEPAIVHEARQDLKKVMKSISKEIERVSPSSSQESIRRHRSVFDRSSSSSSSIPDSSGDDGLSRNFTWDLSDMTPPVESPKEIGLPSTRFNLDPFVPHIYRETNAAKDIGYETDGENAKPVAHASPALSQLSYSTERPKSAQTSSPPQQFDEQGWQVVEKTPKLGPTKEKPPKRPRFPRHIRGPKLAEPILKVFPVEGRSASSGIVERTRTSSMASASEALTAVHNASPLHSDQEVPKLVDERPLINDENAPTYATVAARRAREMTSSAKQRSSSSPGGKSRPTFLGLQNNASEDSLSSAIHTSPFVAEPKPDRMAQSTYSEPDQGRLTQQLHALDLNVAQGTRYHTRHLSAVRAVAPAGDMSASTPSVITYIPPLPYESNIEVAHVRRQSLAARPASAGQSATNLNPLSHPSAIMPGASPPPPSKASEIPVGSYISDPVPQPMTRGPSAQSYQSWATDPIHLPPRLSPMPSTAQAAMPANIHHVIPHPHAISGAGSWVGDVPSYPPTQPQLTTPFSPDVGYAAQHQLRAIDPLSHSVAGMDRGWEYREPQPMLLGAHPMEVRETHQRLGAFRPYDAPPVPGHLAPLSMYHPNLSGPLIPHELHMQPQEMPTARARSGSSPAHPGFDRFGMN